MKAELSGVRGSVDVAGSVVKGRVVVVVFTGADVSTETVVETGVVGLMTAVGTAVVLLEVIVSVTGFDGVGGMLIVKEVTGFVQPGVNKPFRMSPPRTAAPTPIINSRRVKLLFLSN